MGRGIGLPCLGEFKRWIILEKLPAFTDDLADDSAGIVGSFDCSETF